jgi:hypothetical protein
MNQQQQQTQMQTVVVHREQLTADNLKQLGEAGYSILNDKDLLIFGRIVQEQQPLDGVSTAASAPDAASANGNDPADVALSRGPAT